MSVPSEPTTYRSGPKKGLPKLCECGGRIEYAFSFGRVWSVCSKCSPAQRVNINKLRIQEPAERGEGEKE